MLAAAFDFGEDMKLRTVEYKLYQPMWAYFTHRKMDISFGRWKVIKYLNAKGTGLHKDVKNLPSNKGGLYLFFIQCPVITGMTEFPCYIGRAQYSTSQNLKKRCREYFQKYAKTNERPKITRMMRYWGKDLFLAYYPLSNNKTIQSLEKQLINSLLLPMNEEIPDTIIRQAKKAFQ
jgi:hypothetical protein